MSIRDGQKRLREISNILKNNQSLPEEDKQFLIIALTQIADGMDANQALNVKARRGERKSKIAQDKKYTSEILKRCALSWIATAKTSEEDGGLGLTLEDAIGRIGENGFHAFGFTEETLKTYWNKHSDLQERGFNLPD